MLSGDPKNGMLKIPLEDGFGTKACMIWPVPFGVAQFSKTEYLRKKRNVSLLSSMLAFIAKFALCRIALIYDN